ncbi:hypothetical protein AAG906_026401 [Vitis piasezkii]
MNDLGSHQLRPLDVMSSSGYELITYDTMNNSRLWLTRTTSAHYSRYYEHLMVMVVVDMNDFESSSQGFRSYEQLRAMDDILWMTSTTQGHKFMALDAMNSFGLWITLAILGSHELKALDAMNRYGLWITWATLGHELRALDVMNNSRLSESQQSNALNGAQFGVEMKELQPLQADHSNCACHIEYDIAEEAMNFMSFVAEVSRGWDEPNARDLGRMKRLEEIEMKKMQEVQAISHTPLQAMPCAICLSYKHLVDECPTILAVREMFGDCNTYNSNWRTIQISLGNHIHLSTSNLFKHFCKPQTLNKL